MKRKYCHKRKNFSGERLQHICSINMKRIQRNSDYRDLVEIEDAYGNTHLVSSNDTETISKIQNTFGLKENNYA